MSENRGLSHWNYRVTRQAQSDGSFQYSIREVYYLGKKVGWTAEDVGPYSDESVDDLRGDYKLLGEAFDHPVLDITDEDNPYEVLPCYENEENVTVHRGGCGECPDATSPGGSREVRAH